MGEEVPPAENCRDSSTPVEHNWCLYTLVQIIRGKSLEELEPNTKKALEVACAEEAEVVNVGDMEIRHCVLSCQRKIGGQVCRLEVGHWRTKLPDEDTYLYAHSKDVVSERGCLREIDFEERMQERVARGELKRLDEPSSDN